MRLKMIKIWMAAGAMGALTLGAGAAQAVPTLSLSSGADTFVIADGDLLDVQPAAGVITFNGAVGNFTVNVTTGLAYPALGSAAYPELELNSVDLSSIAGGTLTLKWSNDGYAFQPSLGGTFGVGGVLGSGATLGAGAWFGQSLFDEQTAVGGTLSFGPGGAFSGTTGGAYGTDTNADGLYALTEVVTLTHEGAAVSSFDAYLTTVPEPASMVLLGSGLLGLAGVYRLRKKI